MVVEYMYLLKKIEMFIYLLGSMSEQLAVGVSKEEFEKLAVAKGWEEIKIFLSKL
jgi:hypothetical protein